MNQPARKHHYLPQAYLAAFTDTGTKDGQFYVFDIRKGTRFCTSPKNVAAERDFNRVDLEGESPDILEQAFSPFEGRARQAIRRVNLTKLFPNDEDYKYIINLLCLIAIRNPRLRRLFNESRQEIHRRIADLLVSNKRLFDYQLKKTQKAGTVPETTVTFEQAKQFIEEGGYQTKFIPADNLEIEMDVFERLLPTFGRRRWSLLVAPIPGPDFICSDHPIALTWKNPGRRELIGYKLKDTEVFFPLGPKTGFYGVYEDPLDVVVEIESAQVVMMNCRIVQSADRHVFSKREELSEL